MHASALATSTKHTDAERFSAIEAKTVLIAHEFGPFDEIIREDYVQGRNKRAKQAIYGAWAAVDVGLGRFGYAVTRHITPTAVKALVGGKGDASKDEVAAGVRRLLGLPRDYRFEADDASDAAAVVLAWLIREGMIKSVFQEKGK